MEQRILEWVDPGGHQQNFELTRAEIIVGRRNDADIVVSAPSISRQHAKFVTENDSVSIVDLNSSHGIYVNGEKVTNRTLRPGDKINLGRKQFEITYRIVHSAEKRPPVDRTDTIDQAILGLTDTIPSLATPQSDLGKLSMLLDFEYQWKQQFSPEDAFQQILTSALKISGAERGYIMTRTGQSFVYSLGLDSKLKHLGESDFKTSRTVVKKVSETLAPVFMTEGLTDEFAIEESIISMNLRALACLPLIGISQEKNTSEILGILYLDSRNTMHTLSGLDEKILSKLAHEAGNALEKLAMIRGIEEKQTLEKELAMAHETQVNLLPAHLPEMEGFAIRAFCKPTRYVGGDFYDFVILDDQLITMLADVSGKGIPASLLSSSIQGALQLQLRSGSDPKCALEEMNRYLCERTESNRFATLFLATLDKDGKGSFLSAGHIPSYLHRARTGEIEELSTGELILGAFEMATYTAKPLVMEEGDILLILSDGVTEAHNPKEETFDEDRLLEVMRQSGAEGTEVLESHIFRALEEFTAGMHQTDDITFILIERLCSST